MKDFFIQNWRLLLEAAICICSFVFCLVRKKPVKVVDTLSTIILRLLPGLINSAEIAGGNGSAKLQYVLDHLVEILKECNYGDEVIAPYLPWVKDQVEVILSTPQKKGM